MAEDQTAHNPAARAGVEPADQGNPATSPFIYFVAGIAVFPPNRLREAVADVLATDGDAAAMRDAAEKRVIRGLIGGTHTVIPDSYWYHFLVVFLSYSHDTLDASGLDGFARTALASCVASPPQTAWQDLRESLIADIDNLTGWRQSTQRLLAERDKAFRGDDGNCYRYWEDGTLVHVIDGKTAPETRIDYITDQALRSYGRLRHVLNLFAASSIAFEFARDPAQFPRSMKATLAEPARRSTGHNWWLLQYDRTRSVLWRPPSVYCDPEWLAADLMGYLTDTLNRDLRSEFVERHRALPSELDADCNFQLDYALDTTVSIGPGEQVFIEFEGRMFRWINGTPETKALISVGVKEMRNHREEDECLNRLLSLLVWEHKHPIAKGFGASGPKRSIPIVWAPRSNFGLRIEPRYLFGKATVPTSARWLALALFKEGVNSQSVFYRFLNFWKCIELAIPDKNARTTWIDQNGPAITFCKDRVDAIVANGTLSGYLAGRCRNAIAHIFRKPFINPDDPDDYVRISRDLALVTALARKAVDDFLPPSANEPFENLPTRRVTST